MHAFLKSSKRVLVDSGVALFMPLTVGQTCLDTASCTLADRRFVSTVLFQACCTALYVTYVHVGLYIYYSCCTALSVTYVHVGLYIRILFLIGHVLWYKCLCSNSLHVAMSPLGTHALVLLLTCMACPLVPDGIMLVKWLIDWLIDVLVYSTEGVQTLSIWNSYKSCFWSCPEEE